MPITSSHSDHAGDPSAHVDNVFDNVDDAGMGDEKMVADAAEKSGRTEKTTASSVEEQARLASQVQHLSHLTRTLGQEKHFLRAALDSAEDALVAFDINGTFALCNSGFEQLFGLRATDLEGRNEEWLRGRLANRLTAPDAFFHQPRASATTQNLNATTENETPESPEDALHSQSQTFQIELKPVSQSGAAQGEASESSMFRNETFGDEVFVAEALRADTFDIAAPGEAHPETRVLRWYSGPVRDDANRLVGHIATQRDITRETQVDRMKTDFIAIVSHELRTPLTSIKGYVDLILDGDTGDINSLQRDFLSTVQRNTRRLVAMVNDMLDISRIESGGIEFDLRPLSLSSVIEQAFEIMKPQADEKNLRLELMSPSNSRRTPRVVGDFDRVLQVLTNLLSNAVKYTPPQPIEAPGLVQVEVHWEHVARVAVRDWGIGISSADQAQLFHKFFRADNSVTREVAGSGLGLPITRALIEKMGGELHVKSEAGTGSEFSFTLPLALPWTSSNDALASREGAVHGIEPRVLVVDDDPDIVDLISLFLGRNGYQTASAYSGAEALRLLQSEHFDAVTLDVLMPHMDGFSVLRQLREHERTRDLPVVVVSVNNTPPEEQPNRAKNASTENAPSLQLGAYDFISKPFDERMLYAALDRALGRDGETTGAPEPLRRETGDAAAIDGAAIEGAPRALLVDGEGVLADEISGLLQAQGAQVVVVATPAEALAEARQNPVHLVVLNPLEWGEQTLQLVESLREEPKGRAPFLLFTEPGGSGQHVLSRLSSHLPSALGAPHEYSCGADTSPNHDPVSESHALRDLCARLDEILHHHSAALDNQSPDAAA